MPSQVSPAESGHRPVRLPGGAFAAAGRGRTIPRLRPLRRVEPGVWTSRDGRFTFTGPAAQVQQGGSNELFWHIHDATVNDAWGEREPTLADAVYAVEQEYRDLLAAPEDARDRILKAIRRDGEPCEAAHIVRWAGMAKEQTRAWIDHLVHEGTLLPVLAGRPPRPAYRIAGDEQ